ncbi:hypothetical protein AGLY_006408 [Aphis glycines]|uniref:Uncharacterized protein n=1 Tax=Aphis glycines TaxID=307491 RepID=A0A6G0TTA1_APHGL|nr:hypothetical protein AGLY_006408 [Aphis glycines]
MHNPILHTQIGSALRPEEKAKSTSHIYYNLLYQKCVDSMSIFIISTINSEWSDECIDFTMILNLITLYLMRRLYYCIQRALGGHYIEQKNNNGRAGSGICFPKAFSYQPITLNNIGCRQRFSKTNPVSHFQKFTSKSSDRKDINCDKIILYTRQKCYNIEISILSPTWVTSLGLSTVQQFIKINDSLFGKVIKQKDKNTESPLRSVPLATKSICGLPRNSVFKVHLIGRYRKGKEEHKDKEILSLYTMLNGNIACNRFPIIMMYAVRFIYVTSDLSTPL